MPQGEFIEKLPEYVSSGLNQRLPDRFDRRERLAPQENQEAVKIFTDMSAKAEQL
jgi:hypothetical protein